MGRFMGTEIRSSGESEFQTSKSLRVVTVSEFAALNFFFKKNMNSVYYTSKDIIHFGHSPVNLSRVKPCRKICFKDCFSVSLSVTLQLMDTSSSLSILRCFPALAASHQQFIHCNCAAKPLPAALGMHTPTLQLMVLLFLICSAR